MKRIFYIAFLLLFITSCKSDGKKESQKNDSEEQTKERESASEKTYDDSLLDLRPVDKNLNHDLYVEEFGVDKINDSVYKLVLKLDPTTTNEIVMKYSFGVRGMNDTTHNNKLLGAYAPDLEEIGQNKYVRLRAVLPNTEYFDSLNFYIYERKNWKGSGMLGGFWIRDILLTDE